MRRFERAMRARTSVPTTFVLVSVKSTREALAVDLTLKLNVLAVCAVFAFVGAILLGAF